MSKELKAALRERLDQNYNTFLESLQGKTASELINMAPAITAVQQLHKELPNICDDDDMRFLLRLDNPLEAVRGYWEPEVTECDYSDGMAHTLWRFREDGPDDLDQQRTDPISRDEIMLDPVMDFSGREIVAYAEVALDVGRRFQIYPNIDDTCSLYAKFDPISRTLQGELCIKDGDGYEQWESVEFMPSERDMIVGLMEEVCQKDMGKSLRDIWTEHHPAINRKNKREKKKGRHQHER